jgi:hypothetical protein
MQQNAATVHHYDAEGLSLWMKVITCFVQCAINNCTHSVFDIKSCDIKKSPNRLIYITDNKSIIKYKTSAICSLLQPNYTSKERHTVLISISIIPQNCKYKSAIIKIIADCRNCPLLYQLSRQKDQLFMKFLQCHSCNIQATEFRFKGMKGAAPTWITIVPGICNFAQPIVVSEIQHTFDWLVLRPTFKQMVNLHSMQLTKHPWDTA